MKRDCKIMLAWSGINMLLAPLIGWALAALGVSTLPAAYLMLLIFGSPLGWFFWRINTTTSTHDNGSGVSQ